MTAVVAKASLLALGALVALWAFVMYLQPAFTGEVVSAILRCN